MSHISRNSPLHDKHKVVTSPNADLTLRYTRSHSKSTTPVEIARELKHKLRQHGSGSVLPKNLNASTLISNSEVHCDSRDNQNKGNIMLKTPLNKNPLIAQGMYKYMSFVT